MTASRHASAFFFALVLLLALALSACDSFSGNAAEAPPPDRLEVLDLTMDRDGGAAGSLAEVDFEVRAINAQGRPVPRIFGRAVLTQNYLLVLANDPSGRYFPAIEVVALAEARDRPLEVTLEMAEAEALLHTLPTRSRHLDALLDEAGLRRPCATGDLADVLTIVRAAMLTAGSPGTFFHIGADVGTRLGRDGARTAAVADFDDADPGLFAALMADAFGLYDQDVQTICWGEDAQGQLLTPFYWQNVELHRDFAFRLTLTWSETPNDLDAILLTPSIGGTEHVVYFGRRGSLTRPPYAALDHDDTRGDRPEIITIDRLFPGTYYYTVALHTAPSFSASGGRVQIFSAEGYSETVEVPANAASGHQWWNVFSIDGATGTVEILNEISTSPPRGAASKRGLVQK